jgi:hypothetical protein
VKIQRKITATTIVEVEGDSPAEVFEALAALEEIFAGHETCGLCQKSGVRYVVRRDKQGNKYFMAVCISCGAEFRFGVRRDPPGTLFPQLKAEDGTLKPDGGWVLWKPAPEQRGRAVSTFDPGRAY